MIKNPFRSGGDGVLALSSGNCPLPGFYPESQHETLVFIWNHNMSILVFIGNHNMIILAFYLESQHESFDSGLKLKCFLFSREFPPRQKYFPKQFGLHKRDKVQTSEACG